MTKKKDSEIKEFRSLWLKPKNTCLLHQRTDYQKI